MPQERTELNIVSLRPIRSDSSFKSSNLNHSANRGKLRALIKVSYNVSKFNSWQKLSFVNVLEAPHCHYSSISHFKGTPVKVPVEFLKNKPEGAHFLADGVGFQSNFIL